MILSRCWNRHVGTTLKRRQTLHPSSSRTSLVVVQWKSARTTSTTTATKASNEETTKTMKNEPPIPLKEIPMLPIVGSMLPFYSGTPKLDDKKYYEHVPELRRRFGDFYKRGMPGMGKGHYGELYTLTDPNEYMKVIRQERTSQLPYPRGMIQGHWPLVKYLKASKSGLACPMHPSDDPWDQDGFWGRGETWKQMRVFMQTDLLSPKAANGYIPAMAEAARIASQAAPANAHALNEYMNRCAFDMFNSFIFGELIKTADLNSASPENLQYLHDNIDSLTKSGTQTRSLYEILMAKVIGWTTPQQRAMEEVMAKVFETADAKYQQFRHRYETHPDSFTDAEKNSYAFRAIERQLEDDNMIEKDQLASIIQLMLVAAVDTTSSLLAWNMYHIAVNQNVQEKLYQEISKNIIDKEGGQITEHALKRSTSPFLHAVVRETHRLTPAFPAGPHKENSFLMSIFMERLSRKDP